MRDEYDIGIVGGGMVGASMALALRATCARVVLIESIPPRSDTQPSYDDRGIALSLASCRIMEKLGVWDAVQSSANPIRRVHVSQQGCFGRVQLDATTLGLDALGHVVLARRLGEALYQGLRDAAHVELLCPARVECATPDPDAVTLTVRMDRGDGMLRCRLLIAADGTQSRLREQLGIRSQNRDYGQTALVASVKPARHHDDTAYERFTPGGPLALLPLRDGRCVAVFSVANAMLEEYSRMDDDAFLARLDAAWSRRLGGFTQAGPRRSYPLVMMQAETQILDRVVLLGNAAHTIHPNGAQGFNLGMRDIAGLAEHVNAALQAGRDPGKRAVLSTYLTSRSADQRRVVEFSDGVARLYCCGHWAATPVRTAAMLLADTVPPLKRALLRHGTGLYGRQPAWVRGATVP